MEKLTNIPTFFLWINLDFENDRKLLPDLYLQKLKDELENRKEAGITAPLCFVYISSFLLSDKSADLKAIRDLGIQVIDYDELVQKDGYFQSVISIFLDKERVEFIIKRLPFADSIRADLIDIIKLELLYNYRLITNCKQPGCIMQDFDVKADYPKLEKELVKLKGEISETEIDDFFCFTKARSIPENHFMYVYSPQNSLLRYLILRCDKVTEKTESVLEYGDNYKEFYKRYGEDKWDIEIFSTKQRVFGVFSKGIKEKYSLPEEILAIAESHITWTSNGLKRLFASNESSPSEFSGLVELKKICQPSARHK